MSKQDQMVQAHKHFTMGTGTYRLVAIWAAPSKALQEANPQAYNHQMSNRPKACRFSCDHCGTGIQNHFIIRDSAGEEFSVGSSCIEKLGDTQLITEAKAAENKRQKALRAEKRHQEQLARQAAYKAEIEAERERNGGLTDHELAVKKREAAKTERRLAIHEVAYDTVGFLNNVGDFGRSMMTQILDGEMPTGNALRICVEIMAKQHGRKNSKAYNEAYPACEARLEEIGEKIAEIKAQYPV
jgi:hypothetical protein